MAFPDRIERTVELAHPPAKVWAALTTAEGLGAWFGNEAAIDLRPGGAARMTWSGEGYTAHMRVERVEEPAVFGFTWHIFGLPDDVPGEPEHGRLLHPFHPHVGRVSLPGPRHPSRPAGAQIDSRLVAEPGAQALGRGQRRPHL